ncbi:hypothetical protein ABDK00_012895 [Niabella insulamsoli]|uniref:hypothetical protein n=1 Tax=Niabella insulamsoli TaxID=3144874 RepID=UPI0031FC6ED6
MKSLLICVSLIIAGTLCWAQAPRLKLEMQPAPRNLGDLLDTSQMYHSSLGYVAKLKQDHMPCILPYPPATPIPGAHKAKNLPNQIPNAWRDKPLKKSANGLFDLKNKKPMFNYRHRDSALKRPPLLYPAPPPHEKYGR